ncbi:potassium-transporting ATPase subunit C [Ruficoccus amylovorans]|uniref:Potassium-transporting ATPase subunit C n=1 Tax=Ruficoccus amylovorans TaxID=1804625 RepID=A0A842HB19_9BACT|nr:potassium-transporting ATPase subunit C [Ruficoccus amylovorans]MBC2592916.1 potassium-transporting ATPase subunit C [Ruficoccus amylovorans]
MKNKASQSPWSAKLIRGALLANPRPADLVTMSGSGLDPHISLSAAQYQVAGVAAARGLSPVVVNALIKECATGTGGLAGGAEVVNVLELNLALDQLSPEYPASPGSPGSTRTDAGR